ncbi:hypothetical protein PN823_004482 [Enterobacter hormaechei]|nr:hypothetical protein [Enterobacter hormaechei]
MNIKELDYFDYARLNGHLACFVVNADRSAWIESDGIRYTLDLTHYRENEIDEEKGVKLGDLLKNDKPFGDRTLNQKGILRLINLDDKVWLFAFVGQQKHVCMISMGRFETTLGNL